LLIILVALRKLNEFEYDKIGKEIKATRAAMLLVYIYVGNIMPNYIYDELMDIIKSIVESKLDSWSFFSINESSWIAVKKVLKQWITKCPVSNEILMRIWKTNGCIDKFNDTQEFLGQNSQISMYDEMKASFIERLKKTPEEEFDNYGRNKNDAIEMFENIPAEEFLKINTTLNNLEDEGKFKNVKRDISFANKYRYLLPPFLIQEEAEKSLWFKNSTDCVNSDELDYEAFSFKEMTKYVKKNWKPNVTIIDYEW
jgi:hypothetical protein